MCAHTQISLKGFKEAISFNINKGQHYSAIGVNQAAKKWNSASKHCHFPPKVCPHWKLVSFQLLHYLPLCCVYKIMKTSLTIWKIHCRTSSQIVMRGGWWERQDPAPAIQVSLGARKWTKCMFSIFPVNLSSRKPSLHYPTVFGLHEMTKMCVSKVPYQSLPYKTQFVPCNCVWLVWNDQNVCFKSFLTFSALQNPVCTIQLCLGCMKWPKCVF